MDLAQIDKSTHGSPVDPELFLTVNVVLTFCIDGFLPYDKSNVDIWPLLFQVMNLPESLRMKQSNFILAGVIPYAPKKLQTFLMVVVDELLDLWHTGMTIYDAANNNEEVNIRVMMLGSKADYPARSKMNCQEQQGSYSG